MTIIEFRVGSDWLNDARLIPSPSVNAGYLSDAIDIVIDGDNITAEVEHEPPLLMFADLNTELARLLRGQVPKALITFTTSSWEMAIVPMGRTQLGLSFYNISSLGSVICHERPVPLQPFCRALQEVTQHLHAQLSELVDDPDDPLLNRLDAPLPDVAQLPYAVAEPLLSTVQGTVTSGPIALHYALELATHPPSYNTIALDYHALLIPGSLRLEGANSETLELSASYPVHTLRLLLTRLRATLKHLETLYPPSHLGSDTFGSALAEQSWRITFASEYGSTLEPDVLLDLPLRDLAHALIQLTRVIYNHFLDADPSLESNERLHDLLRRAVQFEAWFAEIVEGNIHLDDSPITLPEQGPTPKPTPRPSFQFSIPDMRRMVLREQWSIAARSIFFRFAALGCGRMLAHIDKDLVSIDLNDGQIEWTHPGHDHSLPFCWDDEHLFVSPQPGQLSRLDPITGQPIWSRMLSSPWELHKASVCQADPPLVIVISSHYTLYAFTLDTGQPLWSTALPHGRPHSITTAGNALMVASSNGFIYGLHAHTGRTLWRFRTRHRIDCLWTKTFPWLLNTSMDESPDLIALDMRTGRPLWAQAIDKEPEGPPIVDGNHIWLSTLERHHSEPQADVLSLELESGRMRWRHPLNVSMSHPTSPLLAPHQQVVVKTDRDEVIALDRHTGEQRWSTHLGDGDEPDVLLSNLPLAIQSGAVVVPGSTICLLHPKTGHIIHRLSGLPHHPEFFHLTPELQFIIGERDDGESHLTCFGLEHFLAVVQ